MRQCVQCEGELERAEKANSNGPAVRLQLLTHTRDHRSTTSISGRQQRAHAPNTTLSQVLLGHQLAAAETTRLEIETLLRERDTTIESLEAGR